MNYAGIICKIVNLRAHPNADRIQLGTAGYGNQVVVGLSTQEGQLGIFFPPDGKLSLEMAEHNDLIAKKNPDGTRSGGFFELPHLRIRAQNFRQARSDGFWIPISSLAWTGIDLASLKEGDLVDTLNGHCICEKYYTPATLRALQGKQGKVRRGETLTFRKHPDTPQLRHVVNTIPPGAILWVTVKAHGTSHRMAHVLDEVALPRWKQWINTMYPVFPTTGYTVLHGSRNVILESIQGSGGYEGDAFRYKACQGISLRKGECLYMEIVGYANEQSLIMNPQPITDKQLKKRYGDSMRYTYGTLPGEQKIYIYRIVQMNEDGHGVELSWLQVLARCKELGLQPVPPLAGPIIYDGNPHALMDRLELLAESDDRDTLHIREGLVLRIESEYGTTFAKLKNHTFLTLESIIKDNDSHVDQEEVA